MKKDKFETLADILHSEGLVGLDKFYNNRLWFIRIVFWLLAVVSVYNCITTISYRVAYNELLEKHCIDKAFNQRVMEYNDSLKTYIISVQPKSYK
jgi:hypothetical protein